MKDSFTDETLQGVAAGDALFLIDQRVLAAEILELRQLVRDAVTFAEFFLEDVVYDCDRKFVEMWLAKALTLKEAE